MSGSVYFEGNAFIDGGRVQNTTIATSSIGNCAITTSSLDMNMANITSVKDPINAQDAATKKYVDDLEISFTTVNLVGTNTSLISNNSKGSYIISVNNLILNGPSGIFHLTKSESTQNAHIVRTVAAPGVGTNITLRLTWPPNSGIFIMKTGNNYDGSYRVKIM